MTLIAISLSLLAGSALLVPPAGAKRVLLELRDRVQASTTLARLNQKVVLSAGTFVGTVNDSGRIKATSGSRTRRRPCGSPASGSPT